MADNTELVAEAPAPPRSNPTLPDVNIYKRADKSVVELCAPCARAWRKAGVSLDAGPPGGQCVDCGAGAGKVEPGRLP